MGMRLLQMYNTQQISGGRGEEGTLAISLESSIMLCCISGSLMRSLMAAITSVLLDRAPAMRSVAVYRDRHQTQHNNSII